MTFFVFKRYFQVSPPKKVGAKKSNCNEFTRVTRVEIGVRRLGHSFFYFEARLIVFTHSGIADALKQKSVTSQSKQ